MKNVQDVYKLSPLQLTLLSEPPEASASRIEHLHWRFRQGVDEAALQAALRELSLRHPALRTAVFVQGLNEPMQVVREKVEPAFERHDLSGLPEPEQEARLGAYIEEDRRRGLNLMVAPLARLALFQTGEGTGRLVLGYHALVLDEASARLCLDELFGLYKAARGGTGPELEKGRPYRDYVAWSDQQDPREAEGHFQRMLRGIRRAELPERPAGSGVAAAPLVQQFVLSSATTGQVQGLLRQHKLGLGTVLQAAWALLLRQHGIAGDVLFGAVVSGRPSALPRSESMVGRFAHAIPRRVAVPAEGGLLRWLQALQAELADARRFEHVPLSRIRGWIDAPPDAALFQSAVVAEIPTGDEGREALARSLGFDRLCSANAALPAGLVVAALPGQRLTLRFLYDPRRFESTAVAGLAKHLGALVEAISARPDQAISALPAPSTTAPVRSASIGADGGFGPAGVEAILAQHPLVRQVAVTREEGALRARVVRAPREGKAKKLDFSIFFFADEDAGARDRYRVYLEASKFADRNGFSAVWSPERHFHEHGGLYPNPSVLNAALATITERISLRAGSVVLPLHSPLRVAEEWAVVDNLSNGRAAISVVSGWVPNDFAFAPGNYAKKREVMFKGLEQVQRLWRGEAIPVVDGVGKEVELRVYPRPVQKELPIWLTCSSPDLFEKAGELGFNVLTSLLTQSLEEAGEKIALYRKARERAGRDPAGGIVTLMVHTFVGPDPDDVLEKVRGPLTAYLRSHVALMESFVKSMDLKIDINEPKWLDYLASFAFERYYRTGALIGTPASCLGMVDRLFATDVDEVACFMDFGVDADTVLGGLTHLATLKRFVEDESLRMDQVLSGYLGERLPGHAPPVRFEAVDAIPIDAIEVG